LRDFVYLFCGVFTLYIASQSNCNCCNWGSEDEGGGGEFTQEFHLTNQVQDKGVPITLVGMLGKFEK
jgi:hypothetical protein